MRTKYLYITILLFLPALTFTQTREEVERKRENTLRELENARAVLSSTSEKKKSGIHTLMILNRKIDLHERMINNLNAELRIIEDEIEIAEKNISDSRESIEKIKSEYARIIYHSYLNRKEYDKIAFIFASKSFNQAYKRIKYIQQYGRYRKEQAARIIEEIERERTEIEKMKALSEEKYKILEKRTTEAGEMDREKKNKENMVRSLGREESKLMAEVKSKEKIAKELETTINRLIEEERKRKSFSSMTPEDKIISDQFRTNKGKLPWPTERGIITSYFGENPHPVMKGVKIKNNGVDISTTQNAEARALFNGEVRMVVSIPGANKLVVIRHGNFMTMYSNLADVYVKVGDRVNTKQTIGKIFTDISENGKTVLHLEIWEERNVQNPVSWLSTN